MNVGSFLLALILSMLMPVQAIQNVFTGWTPLGRGIDYQEFQVSGPNRVYVARMYRSDPNVTIESAIALGTLGKGLETVRGMAAREDDSINFWPDLEDTNALGSWGKRSEVVVAINGSFLEERGSLLPQNGMVKSGWFLKQFDDYLGWSGFALTLDGNAFIGDCVFQPADKQLIRFSTGLSMEMDGINQAAPDPADTIVYTYHIGGVTPSGRSSAEVVVDLNEPLMVMPSPNSIPGKIVSIRTEGGGTPIQFNQVVISAGGSSASQLLNTAREGDTVQFSTEISHYPDCKAEGNAPLDDWTRTYTSIGGTRTYLKNGEIIPSASDPNRHPRTAVALDSRYIYFIVVDGREPGWSIGMTLEELGAFTRDQLHATWGIAQDGGGSSTMVVNGVVVNNPSDVCYPYTVYLPMVGRDLSGGTTQSPPVPQPFPSEKIGTGHCERPVANGLMMVKVQPMATSSQFAPGDQVMTTDEVNLRLGPGTNYAALARIPADKQGIILEDANGLDGVFAKGYHWWHVDFDGLQGWVAEDYIR